MRFSVLGFRSEKRIELQAPVDISDNNSLQKCVIAGITGK